MLATLHNCVRTTVSFPVKGAKARIIFDRLVNKKYQNVWNDDLTCHVTSSSNTRIARLANYG